MKINENEEFAKFLEDNLPELFQNKIESAAIVAKTKEELVYTGYYNASATDKAIFSHNIYTDAMLDVVLCNIDMIREALEGEGDDDARD